jgi:hypothetical protein
MESVRLICATSGSEGERWLLKRIRKGLVLLDEDDNVVALIPTGEVSTRIHFPSFWLSRAHITIEVDGAQFLFQPTAKAREKVNALIEDCEDADPAATAASYRSKAWRDLLIGTGSFLLGSIVTCLSFALAEPNGKFIALTGFIVVGLVEIVRGIYFALKASQLRQAAERDDEDDEDDEDEDD